MEPDIQESVKTKHPQLHYESKIYMLLQGGSELCFNFLLSFFLSTFLSFSLHEFKLRAV